MHMGIADIANTTGDHYGFVVPANRLARVGLIFKGTEVSVNGGPAKFIIKARCANWPFQHNLQSRDHMIGFAGFKFPRLGQLG